MRHLFNQAGIPVMCIAIGLFAGMLIQKRSDEALVTQVLQSAAFSSKQVADRLNACEDMTCDPRGGPCHQGGAPLTINQTPKPVN